MFRFISVVWNDSDSATSVLAQRTIRTLEARGSFVSVHSSAGIRVFSRPTQPSSTRHHVLAENGGVVVGALFTRQNPQREIGRALGAAESMRIVDSGGQTLVSDYWGRYIAFIRNAAGTKWVLRGPASDSVCLTASHDGVRLYFSLIEDVEALLPMRFTINWEYLARHLIAPGRTNQTGLNEVTELLPGVAHEIHGSTLQELRYWSAFEIAARPSLQDSKEIEERLRTTVNSCTTAWASRHKSILLYLSGGLDSSIVLGALPGPETGPDVTCVNYHSRGAASDERVFARAAASRRACTLVERERSTDVTLEDMLTMPRTARPEIFLRALEHSRRDADLARTEGATAIFTGSGGDEVFYRDASRYAVSDWIQACGISRRLGSLAFGAAIEEGLTVWTVLRRGLQAGLLPHRWSALTEYWKHAALVSPRFRTQLEQDHWKDPMLSRSSRDAAPGQLWHAYLLSGTRSAFDPNPDSDSPEEVAPLLSQPVIELCLRIPSYEFHKDGWDRAIARSAFRTIVAPEIIARRSKGGMEEHAVDVIRRNISFVRDLLLDGELVRNGILDRAKLSEILSDRPSAVTKGIAAVFDVLFVEVWLHLWSRSHLKAAA